MRSKRITADRATAFTAICSDSGIRVDRYIGRRKVRNFAYFLDVSSWPVTPSEQWWRASRLLCEPTVLDGPPLVVYEGLPSSWCVDAAMRAIVDTIESAGLPFAPKAKK